jgi:murein DD-endopeptidase MepM/ murein hydrolase activator NlpD
LSSITFVSIAISKGVDISRLERLEKINHILAQDLVRVRAQLDAVNDTVEAIMERDRQVRVLAGLDPTDPDVQLAGIGGPSGEPSERERLLGEDALGREVLRAELDLDNLIRRANLLSRSFQEAAESLASHQDRLLRTPSIWPTRGWLSSSFANARMHPIFHQARPHEGIDISAPMGTPIVAPAAGLVIDVGREPGYGLQLRIDHGYGVVTRYAHCSKVLVRVGQRVRRGDTIALVGNSGISTSPHLHYEVAVNGRTLDPRWFIFPETIVH